MKYSFLFLIHIQDRIINVSEILPLRSIEVNYDNFYLLLRSGYFVKRGCVFTRVYVICKICEKLRRIHSCRYLLDSIKKEWVLVRREVLVSGLFFRSRSVETFYFASILKMIATAAQAASLESVQFCCPIAPQDIWGLLYIIVDLSAFSDRSLHS